MPGSKVKGDPERWLLIHPANPPPGAVTQAVRKAVAPAAGEARAPGGLPGKRLRAAPGDAPPPPC